MLRAKACCHGNAENALFPLNRLRYAPTIPELVEIYDDNTSVSPLVLDNCRLLRSGSLIAIGHTLAVRSNAARIDVNKTLFAF